MFEIGEEVTIRHDLSASEVNVNRDMTQFAGRNAIVRRIISSEYAQLDVDRGTWHWGRAMLEPVPFKAPKVDKKYKPQDLKWTPKPLEQSVRDAIESIRTGYYAGTYLKGELEAQLDRGSSDDETCWSCDGEGTHECENTHAVLLDQNGTPVEHGWGPESEESCAECVEGYISCDACGGSGRTGNDSEWGDRQCQAYIMSHVSQDCRDATTYSGFVYDGSVDSEFKFTVPLTWEGLGYAIEYIKAFKALANAIGNGLDVQGAGMHLTILRSQDGTYPRGNANIEPLPFENFKANMTRLMPALYLLASEDNKSRPMGFRRPGVQLDSHGHAISGAGGGSTGALEWRVFETCYRRPEMLLDFICVIAKGLSFYAPVVKPVKFRSKIGKLEFFDKADSQGVHKYFHTEKHLVALKQGLKYLIPDHRTESEVLRLRNMHKLTPEAIKRRNERLTNQFETAWIEYRKDRATREDNYILRVIQEYGADTPELIEDFKARYRRDNPDTKRAFMKRQLDRALGGSQYDKVTLTI